MAATVSGILLTGVHGSRPTTGVSAGTLYSCTTHGLVYQTSDTGSTWATWATLGGSTGTIVQVKTANLASDHSTTAATMQDSGLSLAFTPLFADSILHVNVDGECQVSRAAGTLVERYQWVGILNSTDAVELTRQVRGHRGPAAGSADLLTAFNAIALKGTYTVNSLTARTFKLQHMAGVVTNLNSTITGSRTGGVTMTIMEVRP